MCGIIASIDLDKKFNNTEKVLKQFEEQKSRGQQGFGFVAVKDGEVQYGRAKYFHGKDGIKALLEGVGENNLLIFHHRIPTCTPNAVEANHPLFIRNKKNLKYKYFLIHNGIISNADELRVEHEKMGFKYHSIVKFKGWQDEIEEEFTDSEALGIELALFIEKKIDVIKIDGSVACFLLQIDDKNRATNLFYYRTYNPINYYRNKSGVFFSSEGKGESIEPDTIFRYNLAENKVYITQLVDMPKPPTSLVTEITGENPWTDDEDPLRDHVHTFPKKSWNKITVNGKQTTLEEYLGGQKVRDLNNHLEIASNKLAGLEGEYEMYKAKGKDDEEAAGCAELTWREILSQRRIVEGIEVEINQVMEDLYIE